jgi:putative hydrolase of the HAD superfamily
VRALCLDATGTLIETAEPVGEVYRRHALEQGVDLPAWRIEDAFRRILAQAPPRGLAGATPAARRQGETGWWRECVRQTFQATDSTVRFPDFEAFARSLFDFYRQGAAWRIRPGVREMLVALRARGLLLAVVSNFDHRLIEIIQAIDLMQFFEFVLIPSEAGLRKPDPRLLEQAADRLGVSLGQLGYLGDDPPEILAAIARLGVAVFDVREIGEPSRIPDLVVATATLPPRPDASGSDAS